MSETGGKQISLKAKVAILILCPLIVIALCSVAIVITVSTLVDDEKYDFGGDTAVALVQPDEAAAQPTFMGLTLDAADDAEVYVEKNVDVSLSDIDGDISDAQKGILNYLAGDISASLRDMYSTEPVKYGEDPSCINPGDFAGGCTEAKAELNEEATKLSYTFAVDPQYKVFTAKYEEADSEIAKKVMEKSTDCCTVKNISAKLDEVEVKGESDSENRLTKISVRRTYSVNVVVSFADDLASLGTQNLTMKYSVNEGKNIKYAGISISEDRISLDKNGFQTLSITANIAEDATDKDYKLTFTSSDESIAKADPNGMVEAVSESEMPVTITATLEYLGRTYTDTCIVSVGVPVEEISVSPRKQTIGVGDIASFTAKIEPKNATIKSVIWISEDQSVCTVDALGRVTAIKPGDTRIIAVSEDGHFMSAAEIIVE